jgi:hypothetical protein
MCKKGNKKKYGKKIKTKISSESYNEFKLGFTIAFVRKK